jgi:hypothetical protein
MPADHGLGSDDQESRLQADQKGRARTQKSLKRRHPRPQLSPLDKRQFRTSAFSGLRIESSHLRNDPRISRVQSRRLPVSSCRTHHLCPPPRAAEEAGSHRNSNVRLGWNQRR